MKFWVRLFIVVVFQLNALNALAGMADMGLPYAYSDNVSESQNGELDSHCDVSGGTVDHCHCVVCFAITNTETVGGSSNDSRQLWPVAQNARAPYYGIYKPPQ